MLQEAVTFFIVFLALVYVGRRMISRTIRGPMANYLLRKGHVKLAFRLKHGRPRKSCC